MVDSTRSLVFVPIALWLAGCAAGSVGGGEMEEIEEGERSAFVTNRVCPGQDTVEGVDVSYWDPNVDWQKVKDSGRKFAIARISYGHKFPDPDFDKNWQAIKDHGLIRGLYQFFRPSQDPVKQAELVVNKVGMLGPGDLPAVLDIETTEGYSAWKVVEQLKQWVQIVTQGTGKKPIIYTNWGTWGTLGNPQDLAGSPLWVAHYTSLCPLTPVPWTGWVFWQYSENGIVPGVPGSADVNVFNGTLAQLEALANAPGGVASPPVPPAPDGGAPLPSPPASPPPPSSCHAGDLYDWTYCSASCPCAAGEGDCDEDDECQPGLTCVHNVGASYGVLSSVDVCD
jgi:lysozyme